MDSSLRDVKIIAASPYWALNGVNVFSENLVRALCARDLDARILLTEEQTARVTPGERILPFPDDLPFDRLPVGRHAGWGARWGAMIRYLEEHAPCIYLPNADWRHSVVTPRLSEHVAVIGIAHSDEPLHEDHVVRLGAGWNRVVAVNSMIKAKLDAMPGIAGRTAFIPIGVQMPEEPLKRPVLEGRPVRLLYCGRIVQRQKRIFDLLALAEELRERKVSFEITVAGTGPDEAAFAQQASALEVSGCMHLAGPVARERLPELYADHDLFLLPSEFEGLPNALLEAMAAGCVPIVSELGGEIAGLVQHGENGFMFPAGSVGHFAGCVEEAAALGPGLAACSQRAREAVSEQGFTLAQMADAYERLFREVREEQVQGRWRRAYDPIKPPPQSVDGVSILPVSFSYETGDGTFLNRSDAQDFRQTCRARLADACRKSVLPRVIAACPQWALSGVNVFTAQLLRGLEQAGVEAELLLTEEDTALVQYEEALVPPGVLRVTRLPVTREEGWGAHWAAMIKYLEARKPCIYLPGYDWRHSCVGPRLSREVMTVGILHSDEAVHYDHAARLGACWDAVIGVSRKIAREVEAMLPDHAERVYTVPYGVEMPPAPPPRNHAPGSPLRIIYHGVIKQYQKRIFDLAEIINRSLGEGLDACFTIAGTGPDLDSFKEKVQPWADLDRVRYPGVLERQEMLRELLAQDVFIMTSEFEGMPNALLEAMAQGCIPLVSAIESGIPELVEDGENGFVVPVGDITAFVNRLCALAKDQARRETLSARAYRTVRRKAGSKEDMLEDYLSIFQEIHHRMKQKMYVRPVGEMVPPPARVDNVSLFQTELPFHVKGIGSFPSEGDYLAFRKRTRGRLGLVMDRLTGHGAMHA